MAKRSQNKPERKSWLDYAPHVLSLAALLFSIYQFVIYQDVDRKIKDLTVENMQLDTQAKQSDLREKEFKQRIQFENRYLVTTDRAVATIVDYNHAGNTFITSVVRNKVLDDLSDFIGRADHPDIGSPFSYTEAIDFGKTAKHGLVVLRIHNTSSVQALQVNLVIKWHDFPNATIEELAKSNSSSSVADLLGSKGNKFVQLWEIKASYQSWTEEKISIADIPPNGEIIVPLAHVLSTNYYFGRVVMPIRLEWNNPVLEKQEDMAIGNMVPTDQWLFTAELGENFYVAQ
jgi:hypothetical protein